MPFIKNKYYSEYGANAKNNLTYTRKDLLGLLKRHSGINRECDCNCPYTGHSIAMLIMFVSAENNLREVVKEKALEIYKSISNKQCFIGKSRLGIAAAIFYIASLYHRTRGQYSQEVLGILFYTSPATIREKYKQIIRQLPDNLRYIPV